MEDTDSADSYRCVPSNKSKSEDSFIVFDRSEEDDNCNETSSTSDTVSYDGSHSPGDVNWRRPSRRYHCINDNTPTLEDPPAFLYIQMQLCQKQSLREWLVENKERHFFKTLDIFKQIVSAVEYVHLQGLIHRDLKVGFGDGETEFYFVYYSRVTYFFLWMVKLKWAILA